jgi:diguanylate cyclase (GGDEF)-like protein
VLLFLLCTAPLAAQIATRDSLVHGIEQAHLLPPTELDSRLARHSALSRNDEIFLVLARLQNSLSANKTAAVSADLQRVLSVAESLHDETTQRLVYSELSRTFSSAGDNSYEAVSQRELLAIQQAERNHEESVRLKDLNLLHQEQLRTADAEQHRKDQQISALRAQSQLIAAEKMRQQLVQSQSNQQAQIDAITRRGQFKNTLSILLGICLALAITLAWSLWRVSIAHHQQSLEDPLTGLKNRRFLTAFMEQETERLRRSEYTALILIADVDFFKKVNDDWGHEAGDNVLVQLSEVLRFCVRHSDVIVRWGGEEFVIICPQSSNEHVKLICNRLRHHLQQTPFRTQGGDQFPITLSIGAALFSPSTISEPWESALARADKALLQVKRNGRDNWSLGTEQSLSGAKPTATEA